MKLSFLFVLVFLFAVQFFGRAEDRVVLVQDPVIQEAFAGRKGCLVLIDCKSGATSVFRPQIATEKFPPCSTFKIWNTLIGLETGVLSSANQAFYKWDGTVRAYPDWNKDLTLREAFQVSCVPAYQELARKIGGKRMKVWIDKIAYGDRNISSGLDVFWLPAPGRESLLISPTEQARLMAALATGKVPFSVRNQTILKEVMLVQKTAAGTLYGKTGSGLDAVGKSDLGWFVGYLERGNQTYAFACLITDREAFGKEARAVVEKVFNLGTP